MRSNLVPPPPVGSWETTKDTEGGVPEHVASLERVASKVPPVASKVSQTKQVSGPVAPLDAAFLRRVYRSVIWFSLFSTILVGLSLASAPIAVAFGVGALLAAVLLKTQEMFVRRILRPRDAGRYTGWDRFIPLWVLVPLKYAVVTVALGYGFKRHLILPVPFVCGFGIVQLVITAKVMGYLLSQRVRTVRETYIESKNVQA